jgi:IclR family transcriptional regulator, acetate operon repressor
MLKGVGIPDPAGAADGPQPVESAANVLRLLLLFRDHGSVRVSQAARHLGVAPSTAHRLLAVLARHGFAAQDPATRAYGPGTSLIGLSAALLHLADLRVVARPYLDELVAAAGETVSLSVLRDGTVTFIESLESHRPLRVTSTVGTSYQAHRTAAGKALLAWLPAARLAELYAGRGAVPRLAPGELRALAAELAGVREAGYATNRGESGDDIGAVAVPVWATAAPPGPAEPGPGAVQPAVSLSVSMPLSRFAHVEVAELGALLIDVAGRLRTALRS